MSPKFEQNVDPKHKSPKGREDIHKFRYQTRRERTTTEMDVEADATMQQIYKDKKQYEQYKKVGFHEHGKPFLEMIEKWEKDQKLDDDERNMREEVRSEHVTRMGIVKSCERLLTPDIFKGVGDAQHLVNRLAGELGEQRALDLIKPRLINLVGEENGTESLTELWQALRDLHGVYKTNGFNKVYSRIDRYREQYGITPAKWVEIQSGGNWGEIRSRAYGEFQKQHGFFGRMWHSIPNAWHASKIGFAGWREERNGAMQRLRETRSRALDVLSLVLGEDFQQVIDKEIKTGNSRETDQELKRQDEADSAAARGMSEADITTARDQAWADAVAADPSINTSDGYDDWVENVFTRDYEEVVDRDRGSHWLGRLIKSLFSVRCKNITRPAGI